MDHSGAAGDAGEHAAAESLARDSGGSVNRNRVRYNPDGARRAQPGSLGAAALGVTLRCAPRSRPGAQPRCARIVEHTPLAARVTSHVTTRSRSGVRVRSALTFGCPACADVRIFDLVKPFEELPREKVFGWAEKLDLWDLRCVLVAFGMHARRG
jgi:hypothetical protein